MARYDHLSIWKAAQIHRAMLGSLRRVGTPCPRVALAAMPTVAARVTFVHVGTGCPPYAWVALLHGVTSTLNRSNE